MNKNIIFTVLLYINFYSCAMYEEYGTFQTLILNPAYLTSAYISDKIAVGSSDSPSSVFSCITYKMVPQGMGMLAEDIKPYIEPVVTKTSTYCASKDLFFIGNNDLCHVDTNIVRISGIKDETEINPEQQLPITISCAIKIQKPYFDTLLCAGSETDGSLCIWNLKQNKQKIMLKNPSNTPIKYLAALSYTKILAATSNNTVDFIDFGGNGYIRTYVEHEHDTICLLKGPFQDDLKSDTQNAYSGTTAGNIYKYDLRQPKPNTIITSNMPLYDLLVTLKSSSLFIATDNGTIKMYDLRKTDREQETLKSSEDTSSIIKLVKKRANDIIALSKSGMISYWSNQSYPQ